MTDVIIEQPAAAVAAEAERADRHRRGVLTDYEGVLRYVRYLMDALQLRDWAVWLSENPASSTAHASVSVWHRYRGINLFLGKDWRDWEAEDARATLVHEIVHVYTTPIARTFDHLEPMVGELAWRGRASATDIALEQATEGIAMSLAPRLALPQHAPKTNVPAYHYENDGEWFWMLDYPDQRVLAGATGAKE